MTLSDTTMHAIEACYDATVEPTLWPVALQRLGESFGAQSCTFGTWDDATDPFRMPRSEGHEAFAELWMNNGGQERDVHIGRGRRLAGGKPAFILEHDVSSEKERRTHAYFGEIAEPGDRRWWAAVCFTVRGRPWCLPLYRSASRGPFDAAEARYAAAAEAHLSRIVGLAEKLADANLATRFDMLERFNCAAMMLDERGKLTRWNEAANRLLSTGIDVQSGRLVSDGGYSSLNLQALVAAGDAPRSRFKPAIAPVLRRLERPPLLVEIVPISDFATHCFASARVLLTLTEITVTPVNDLTALMAAFGLTHAEGLLAIKVADGQGIAAAAVALGIGIETARSQLKAVFAKTGTHKQAELTAQLTKLRR